MQEAVSTNLQKRQESIMMLSWCFKSIRYSVDEALLVKLHDYGFMVCLTGSAGSPPISTPTLPVQYVGQLFFPHVFKSTSVSVRKQSCYNPSSLMNSWVWQTWCITQLNFSKIHLGYTPCTKASSCVCQQGSDVEIQITFLKHLAIMNCWQFIAVLPFSPPMHTTTHIPPPHTYH